MASNGPVLQLGSRDVASNGPVLQLGSRDVIQTDHSRAWDRNRARVVTSNRPVLGLGIGTGL